MAEKTRPIKKALEQTETRMAELTAAKTRIEESLCKPLPAEELAEAGRRLKATSAELDELEATWLALSEQLEHALAD